MWWGTRVFFKVSWIYDGFFGNFCLFGLFVGWKGYWVYTALLFCRRDFLFGFIGSVVLRNYASFGSGSWVCSAFCNSYGFGCMIILSEVRERWFDPSDRYVNFSNCLHSWWYRITCVLEVFETLMSIWKYKLIMDVLDTTQWRILWLIALFACKKLGGGYGSENHVEKK